MEGVEHLYHDSNLVGSTFSELDAQEYLRTREQNARESHRLQERHRLIDRERHVAERRHRHERELVRSTLQDIEARTPPLDLSIAQWNEDKTSPYTPGGAVNKLTASLPSMSRSFTKNSLATTHFSASSWHSDSAVRSSTKFQIRRVSHITRSLHKLYKRIHHRRSELQLPQPGNRATFEFSELTKKNKESLLRAKVVLKNSKHRDRIESEIPDKEPMSQMRLLSYVLSQEGRDVTGSGSESEDDMENISNDTDSIELGKSGISEGDIDNITQGLSKVSFPKKVTFPDISGHMLKQGYKRRVWAAKPVPHRLRKGSTF